MVLPGIPPSARREYGQALALLPVLDVLGGVVVHARAGERARYAPIISPLVASSAPVAVLGALLSCTGGQSAYLADLDAIMRGPHTIQWTMLEALGHAHAGLELWLDAGFTSPAQAAVALAQARQQWPGVAALRLRAVLGTETLQQAASLQQHPDCVLSLDFGVEGFRGDPAWLDHPEWWSPTVVAMTLARVGMPSGPDLARLQQLRTLAPQVMLYAAGGVRTAGHVHQLNQLGVAGALVASALHEGTLQAAGLP